MSNLKEKIQAFIASYANSGLRDVIESKIVSYSAKMIYRSINKIVQFALKKLLELRTKYDNETDTEKKERKLVGIKLGGACLKSVGEAMILAANALLEGIE